MKRFTKKEFDEAKEKLRDTGDKLGRGLDEKIIDMVAVLNCLGYKTSGSCEGHLDHGDPAPWIDIEPTHTDTVKRKLIEIEEAKKKMDKCWDKRSNMLIDNKNYKKYGDLRWKLDKEMMSDLYKIACKMEKEFMLFYADGSNKYDIDICITAYLHLSPSFRIQNAGINNQRGRSISKQKMFLNMYMDEFNRFKNFLLAKYCID